jgi:hypothetical protein
LNFGAFGNFSPLSILSAPTFLPLAGQPYFGPNILLKKLQEIEPVQIAANNRRNSIYFPFFMGYLNKRIKPTNIFQDLQEGKAYYRRNEQKRGFLARLTPEKQAILHL